MSTEESTGWCRCCQAQRLIRRPGTSHVLHLLLAVITLGLWIPIWLLCSIRFGGWRCTQCGSRVSRTIGVGEIIATIAAIGLGLLVAAYIRLNVL